MWYVVLSRRQKRKDTSPGVQQEEQQQITPSTELVEYEIPVFNKQEIQSITTQDNVAYAGNISLQQNVSYEQTKCQHWSVIYLKIFLLFNYLIENIIASAS